MYVLVKETNYTRQCASHTFTVGKVSEYIATLLDKVSLRDSPEVFLVSRKEILYFTLLAQPAIISSSL